MSNMSYCRFQNTLQSMRDCNNALVDAEDLLDLDLSCEEMSAFTAMFNLMESMMEDMDRLRNVEDENNED